MEATNKILFVAGNQLVNSLDGIDLLSREFRIQKQIWP
jgi:hypothetical protein